jgi:hypothetical protein
MEIASNVALGICLSAACGFRVFVPLLVMSVAGLLGVYTPSDGFAWLATWPALVLFGAATLVEILGYYVPWVDNLLDAIATPTALLAGVVASAAVLGDLPPSLQWILSVVAGAGSAGVVQLGTVLLRGTSTATSGGLANFSVFVVPIVTLLLIVGLGVYLWRFVRGRRLRRPADGGTRSSGPGWRG